MVHDSRPIRWTGRRSVRALAWALALGFVLAPGRSGAQQQVTGQVVDAASLAPIPSAQVSLPALSFGALSNSTGRFLILNVPVGTHEIRVERIGYATVSQQVTVRAGETTEIDFQLASEALGLDEIVVTGTAGVARRREVGNTITQINTEDIIEPTADFESMLQGRGAGVSVTFGSGQLGDGAKIRLRGDVSNALNNAPLIYVDGIRVKNDAYDSLDPITLGQQYGTMQVSSPLNDINPNDIDRIEIVKGAAATTLYGAEGAAGVIQIFTKRGRTGAPVWTAEIDQGFVDANRFGPSKTIRGVPMSEVSYQYPHGGTGEFNGLDAWFRNGWRQRYTLGVRGGTQDLRYFVSGTTEDNRGLMETEQEDRYSIRGNFGIRFNSQLDMDWNTSYSQNELHNVLCGNDIYGVCLNGSRSPLNYISSGEKVDLDRLVYEKEAVTRISRLVTGATLRYQPIASLSNRLTVGYDRADYGGRMTLPYGHISVPLGLEATSNSIEELLTVDLLSSLTQDISDNLGATLSAGLQGVTKIFHGFQGHSEQFAGELSPDLVTLNLGALTLARESRQRVTTGGFFGQALFNYMDRYFLTLGLRVDGSSAFGGDFGLQPYPKASVSYVISDESFWPENLGQLKLRGSYGRAGQAPGAFDAVRTWNPVQWGSQSAFLPDNAGNPDLGPENTSEFDVGFESALFGGRVALDFTYYKRKTTDALVNVTLPQSSGGFGSQTVNLGELEGKGTEISLTTIPIQTRSVTWELGVDYATNFTKILDLGAQNSGSYEIGEPIRVRRGDIITNPNEIADPVFDRNVVLGPNQPTHIITPRMTLRLPRGIVVTARGEYQGGHYIYDGATRWALATGGALPLCAGVTEDVAAGNLSNVTARERAVCIRANLRTGVFYYPADFFKLREVSVQLPLEEFIPGVSQASLTLSGRNLYRWLNEDFWNWDPEQIGWEGPNSSVASMWEQPSPPKMFTASVRVSY